MATTTRKSRKQSPLEWESDESDVFKPFRRAVPMNPEKQKFYEERYEVLKKKIYRALREYAYVNNSDIPYYGVIHIRKRGDGVNDIEVVADDDVLNVTDNEVTIIYGRIKGVFDKFYVVFHTLYPYPVRFKDYGAKSYLAAIGDADNVRYKLDLERATAEDNIARGGPPDLIEEYENMKFLGDAFFAADEVLEKHYI